MAEVTEPTPGFQVVSCVSCRDRFPAALMQEYQWVDGSSVQMCPRCISIVQTFECADCGGTFAENRDLREGDFFYDSLIYPGVTQRCNSCADIHMRNTTPRTLTECPNCGRSHAINPDAEEQQLCPECIESGVLMCPECGEHPVMARGTLILVNTNGEQSKVRLVMCQGCILRRYRKCNHCRVYHPISEIEAGFCIDCRKNATTCDLCGKFTMKGNVVEGKTLCRECHSTRTSVCQQCGRRKIDVGLAYHHRIARGTATGCHDCIGSPILGYKFKKPPTFFGKGKLFFGVENEYDWNSDEYREQTDRLRQWAGERRDFYHLVHDGTLQTGVELVTQPCTFDYWMQMPEILPTIPNRLELGTQGCHIHMSKEAFSSFHLFKFMTFITMHFARFRPVFGRGLGNHRQAIGTTLPKFAKSKKNRSKYWWINMIPAHTIEIRVFRAADSDQVIRRNLQLLHSVYMYTLANAAKDITWDGYMLFLGEDKDYQDLAEFLSTSTPSDEHEQLVSPGEIARSRTVAPDFASIEQRVATYYATTSS